MDSLSDFTMIYMNFSEELTTDESNTTVRTRLGSYMYLHP